MTPKELLKKLRAIAQEKADLTDAQLAKLDSLLDNLSEELATDVIKEYLNELDVKDGLIEVSVPNQNKITLIEKAYVNFIQNKGYRVVAAMMEDMQKISEMNQRYFDTLAATKVDSGKINNIVDNRLGINAAGELKRQGFMKGLLDSAEVRKDITEFAMEKVSNGTGYEDMRKGLRDLIQGDEKRMGKFKQFYRNYAYDLYARVDAMQANLYGEKLELNYFIYAGTRRKTSRHFCIQRKGKVFSRADAAEWKDLIGTYVMGEDGKQVPAGPIVVAEDIETYNPFVDRGGYGCVDDIMWIGDDVAFSMEPDLKNKK